MTVLVVIHVLLTANRHRSKLGLGVAVFQSFNKISLLHISTQPSFTLHLERTVRYMFDQTRSERRPNKGHALPSRTFSSPSRERLAKMPGLIDLFLNKHYSLPEIGLESKFIAGLCKRIKQVWSSVGRRHRKHYHLHTGAI